MPCRQVEYKFMTSQFSTSTPEWIGIDHVQLAIPVDGEDVARSFYVGVLGLTEVPKPAIMAGRGGAWFEAGSTRIHVGAEAEFVPARKAHPALTLRGLRRFIESADLDPVWNDEIEGLVRCHVFDPFGNRVELIDADTIVSDKP
jgi:catechol 2,3-dioxygenase-like lactoylglutathione lyase family enzyme